MWPIFKKYGLNLFFLNWKLKCIFFPWDVLSFGMFCPTGHFVSWDVCPFGRFVLGTFCPWDVLSLGTICPWDLMSEDVLSSDVLSLVTFCPLGRFVPWDVLSVHLYIS